MLLPDVPTSQLTARKRASLAASAIAAALSLTACMGAAPNRPAPQVAGGLAAKAAPTAQSTVAGRRFVAVRGQAQLDITDGPGILVDTNAPPPPPGQAPAKHPFLGASCGGDPLGCSEARGLLMSSSSTDDFVARLRAAGFVVTGG